MAGKKQGKGGGVTIIRKEEVIAGGHHGGAWKVAYADFVTAMMAFFLLMWLLNATTEAQRRGLADYFSPTVSSATGRSGTGKPLGGSSPFADGPAISDRGAMRVMNSNAPPLDVEDDGSDVPAVPQVHADPGGPAITPASDPMAPGAGGTKGSGSGTLAEARRAEEESLSKAAAAIEHAVGIDPALAPLAHQLAIDLTPQGLRIQIRDSEARAMFASGSATPSANVRNLMHAIAPILAKVTQSLAISGYTDAQVASNNIGSNWDLSAQRALTARQLLVGEGLSDARIREVSGNADRDLLLPKQPLAAANRRIAIVLLRNVAQP